jgi:small-conductance mechanosensitive channel
LALSISLWAGLLFAIGGIIKNLVESVIFLFATHPYDVGDRVVIDNQDPVYVKEFGLITTTFTRFAFSFFNEQLGWIRNLLAKLQAGFMQYSKCAA